MVKMIRKRYSGPSRSPEKDRDWRSILELHHNHSQPDMDLCCPLCSVSLPPEGLEGHLRLELRFPLLHCSLCPEAFCDREEALGHFTGPFAQHRGIQAQLIRPPSDPTKTARLLELLRLARGGEEAVEQRLCVCGHCRLLCREDFRAPLNPRHQHFPVKTSPESDIQDSELRQQYRQEDSPDPPFRFKADRVTLKSPQFGLSVSADLWVGAGESEHNGKPGEDSGQPDQEPYETAQWQTSEKDEPSDAEGLHNQNSAANIEEGKNSSPNMTKNGTDGCLSGTNARPEQDYEAPKDLYREEHKAPNFTERLTSRKVNPVKKQAIEKRPVTKNTLLSEKGICCLSCGQTVRRKDAKEHATRAHLKKPLYACRSCDFSISNANAGKINRHVKAVHGQTPGLGTVDSAGLQQHAKAIDAMLHKLFGL